MTMSTLETAFGRATVAAATSVLVSVADFSFFLAVTTAALCFNVCITIFQRIYFVYFI